METRGEPSHSLLSQTAVPFETDDCDNYFTQYEDYDHEQSDQYNPLDGPLKPSEPAEVGEEHEQEGIEDYLMAFDPEESAANGKTDEQGRECANVPPIQWGTHHCGSQYVVNYFVCYSTQSNWTCSC